MSLNVAHAGDPIQAQQLSYVKFHVPSSPSSSASQRPSLLSSLYTRRGFPTFGRLEVKVTSSIQGPYGLTLQLAQEEGSLTNLQERLQTWPHLPFDSMPPVGAPCVMLSWDMKFYRGCITAARDEEHFMVERVDWGVSEVCNYAQLRQVSEELLKIPTFSYRVSLEDAEVMIQQKGLVNVFNGIVGSAKILVAQAIQGAPNRIVLLNAEGRSIRDILADMFDFGRTTMQAGSRTMSPLPSQVLTGIPAMIPHNDLDDEEFLRIFHAGEPGRFFGFLIKNPKEDLKKLTDEMAAYYGRTQAAPLLYTDVKSHTGQFGVIKLDEDSQYYRIKILQEKVNDVEVLLIDDGRRMSVARNDVLAPLSSLSCFRHPPFGIECKVDNVNLSAAQWSSLAEQKATVHVRIEAPDDDFYKVSFTDNHCNHVIKLAVAEKPSENGGQTSPDSAQSPMARGDNRKYRNGDNGSKFVREGHTSYQHPNAAFRNGGTKADKDTNWRAGNAVPKEAIRLPRGPPPMNANEKGPVGFQNNHQPIQHAQPTNSELVPQRSASPPQKEQSTSTVAPAKSPTPTPPSHPTYSAQTPLGKTTKKVEIVFVEAVDSFYVQLSDFAQDVLKLGVNLQELYSKGENDQVVNPTVGAACVANYAEDGMWYRGQILNVDEEKAEILFVDYGNKQTTPLKDVKAIKPDVLNLQPLAYLCRMAGTNVPKEHVEGKKALLEEYYESTLDAIFSSQDANGKHRVRLFHETPGVRKVINELFGAYPIRDVKPPATPFIQPKLPCSFSDFVVGKFYSLDRFYLKSCDAANLQGKLAELDEFYSSLGEAELIEHDPSVGLPCVVKCSEDDKFYRSRIASLEGDTATVVFVDSGHQQQTPCKFLKRILPNFVDFPTLAVECGLKGVKPIANLAPDKQQLLNECFVEGQCVKALFETADGSCEADVTHPKHGDLAKFILENGLAELPPTPAIFATNLIPQDLSKAVGQVNYSDVSVYHAPSPFEFWAQLAPTVVENLMKDIEAYCETLEFQGASSFKPEVGKACLALYDVDKTWYRAVISDVKGEQITIHYVDYGNTGEVTCAELRALPIHLARHPALSVKCTLEGANSIPKERYEEFTDYFRNSVNLRVIKVDDDDVLHVCVTLPDGQNICEKFEGGTAVSEATPQESAPEAEVPVEEEQLEVTEPLSVSTSSEIVKSTNMESELTEPQLVGSSFENTTTEIAESGEEKDTSSTSVTNVGLLNTVPEYTEVETESHVTCDMDATEQAVSNSEAPSAESTTQSASESFGGEDRLTSDRQFADKLAPLQKNFTPGQIISQGQAAIIDITSADGVLLSLDETVLDEISTLITSIGDPRALPLLEPEVGCACLSPYSEDDNWYRATVLRVLEDVAVVQYVDYGNTGSVKFEDLRRLPADLAAIPANGLLCALDGKNSATPAMPPKETLQTLAGKQRVTVVFVNEDLENVTVRLLDDKGVDLVEKLRSTEPGLSILDHSAVKNIFGDATMASVIIDDTRLDATAQAGDSVMLEAQLKKEPIDTSLIALPDSDSDVTTSNENMAIGQEAIIKCDLMQENAELIVTAQPDRGLAQPMVVIHEGTEIHQDTEQTDSVVTSYPEPADQSRCVLDETKLCADDSSEVNAEAATTVEPKILESVDNVCVTGVDVNNIVNQEIQEAPIKQVVYVSYAQSADKFWIQEDYEKVDDIQRKLDSLDHVSAEFALDGNPEVGRLYAVYHDVYKSWFRGRITSIDTTKRQAQVLFVEYGDSSNNAPFDKIHKLPKDLESEPPAAKECECPVFSQDRDFWDEEGTDTFKEICTPETAVEVVINGTSEEGKLQIEMLYCNNRKVSDLMKTALVEKAKLPNKS